MEDHHERAAVRFYFHPRIERQQHHQRADIEQQDTVHNLVDRFRNAFVRIARFSSGDANQLQTAKGEHNDRQREDQPFPASRQEAAVLPQVVDRCTLAAVAGEQQPQAKADHADNRQHLDQRKPELGLTIQAHVHKVNGVNDDEEGRRPDPRWHVREPVLHIDACGGQLRHAHQHEHHPVVPAGEEACERTPVFIGKMREGAGHRLFNNHLAELAHNQEGDNPRESVTQQNRRASHLNGGADAEKQPGTDRAAKGN